MTTLAEMKDLSRRSLTMWSGTAVDDASSIFLTDYINHQVPSADGGTSSIDLAAWLDLVAANHQAFPDLTVDIQMQVGEGDRIATYWCFKATQNGSYEGLAPTGKKISWSGVQIDRFEEDRIAESWVVWDKYSQFSALGMC